MTQDEVHVVEWTQGRFGTFHKPCGDYAHKQLPTVVSAQSLPGGRVLVTFKRANGTVVTENVPDDGSFIAYTGTMDSA